MLRKGWHEFGERGIMASTSTMWARTLTLGGVDPIRSRDVKGKCGRGE